MSDEPLDPEERRSVDLLTQVSHVPVPVDDRFVPAVVRRARLQRTISKPLRAAGRLIAAIAGGIGGAVLDEIRRARR
jgi:hypothetical protein